jgi:hypothetical protein
MMNTPWSFLYNQRVLVYWTFIMILSIFASACGPGNQGEVLPPPVTSCPVVLNWQNIKPGVSTSREVVDILGNPIEKGEIKFNNDQRSAYFAYMVRGGEISEYAKHRVFFRPDGVVDWIEAIVADSDGTDHTVREWTEQVGTTLDTVYFNNNLDWFAEVQYDFQSGPDQALVWSECGLLLLAIWSPPDLAEQSTTSTQVLTLRFPNAFANTQPIIDLTGVVMMVFLFQPTTFDEFMKHYVYRVPYGLWDDYLEQNAH